MKLKHINEPVAKDFKPVKLELTVESIEELRLLFHVFNRNNLKKAIFDGHYGNNYSETCSSDFGSAPMFRLKEIIEGQGFRI